MAKIDKLPAGIERRLPAIRDEWLAIGLATGPADRQAAEAGVRLAYQAAGLEPPKLVIWLGSPLAGAIGATMLRGAQVRDQVWAQVGAQVRDQVWAQVGDQVGAQVRDQVGAQVRHQVWAQVRDQVWAQVGDQVGDQVRDQVWDQVRDQVGAQVRDQVGAQVRDQVWDQVYFAGYGQHDANWLGFYEAFRGLIADVNRLVGMAEIARSAGWWWPFRDAIILTERPVRICRDSANRLHCEDGPAILYPDGFDVWAWHGLRVPRDVIEHPERITVGRIDGEANAELRRVLVERYGLARFLRDGGATLVHRDDWGDLYRRELPGDEPLVMVKVVNSTREHDGTFKDYFLRVHPELRPMREDGTLGEPQAMTARNAVASTFGLRGEDYVLAAQA